MAYILESGEVPLRRDAGRRCAGVWIKKKFKCKDSVWVGVYPQNGGGLFQKEWTYRTAVGGENASYSREKVPVYGCYGTVEPMVVTVRQCVSLPMA